MARARVSSFMTTFGQKLQHPNSASGSPSPSPQPSEKIKPDVVASSTQQLSSSPVQSPPAPATPPPRRTRTERSISRPASMIFPPPLVDTIKDTLPELLPIFTFLNSHANKLYQEGYFLKLNDLDIGGRPNIDRNWTECFAQLVGTVLSLWDAAALDVAGQEGEVAPTFINLADASIKMIETLPTRNQEVQPLQNVLSISTAGKNRYLLHFNSFHSLTQWTAALRLAMFENASLQELYTGSLIAGKGKLLNNIKTIMERSKFRTEDWARVRFGAGTPWRRCWCVIDPPNEKEFQKEQKSLKKRSAYDRPATPPKGDIKFYDSKKTKKATPIATITDAYSAYAIYPQSKPLIDQSTLVKVEGRVTIHSKPESKTEGFVFVMPEVHPAVSGFEMMLRWLFPVYDTFGLYGRPTRLIADTFDNRGIMFAMPKERRYGYLDIQDVAALVCKEGSQSWSEQQWRREMKEVTSKLLSSTASRMTSRQGSRQGVRTSLPAGATLRYEDGASIRSTPSQRRHNHNQSTDNIYATPQKSRTAPLSGSLTSANYHARSASDTLASAHSPRKGKEPYVSSGLSAGQDAQDINMPSHPQVHGQTGRRGRPGELELPPRLSLDIESSQAAVQHTDEVGSDLRPQPPPTPVAAPPAFLHSPGERPSLRPNASPDLRRENSRMSIATLSQLVDASKPPSATPHDVVATAGAAAAWKNNENSRSQDRATKGVNETTSRRDSPADQKISRKGTAAGLNHAETLSASSAPHQSQHTTARRPDEGGRPMVLRKPVRSSGSVKDTIAMDTSSPYTDATVINGHSSPTGDDHPGLSPEVRGGDSAQVTDTSIDHTSTQESSEGKPSELSVSRQRTGVLKTVGNPDYTASARAGALGRPSPIGPPTSPGLRGNATGPGGSSATFRRDHVRTPSDSLTPKEDRRLSYLSGASPNHSPNTRSQSRSPNPLERSVAWQPGAAAVGSGRKSPGPRITAEEFVQQRASNNRAMTPVYAHGKNRSTGHLPQERPPSEDWSKRREAGSRPSSGDVSATLTQHQDYGNHLSAREQEHIARITNSPLLGVQGRSTPSGQVSPGLVGAIQAREQEKKQVRQGISGQMVQQAIAQRQQQAQQQYQAYQQQIAAQQQAQQQTQVLSSQAQAYQAQVAAGFFSSAQTPSRSTPSSPGAWGMQPTNGQWPNPQTQTYWGGMPPQQQQQQLQQPQPGAGAEAVGQFYSAGPQGNVRRSMAGQKK